MFSFNVDTFHRIEWLTFVETNGSLNCCHEKEMNPARREMLHAGSKSYFKTSGLNKTDTFHKKLPLTKIYSLYL